MCQLPFCFYLIRKQNPRLKNKRTQALKTLHPSECHRSSRMRCQIWLRQHCYYMLWLLRSLFWRKPSNQGWTRVIMGYVFTCIYVRISVSSLAPLTVKGRGIHNFQWNWTPIFIVLFLEVFSRTVSFHVETLLPQATPSRSALGTMNGCLDLCLAAAPAIAGYLHAHSLEAAKPETVWKWWFRKYRCCVDVGLVEI